MGGNAGAHQEHHPLAAGMAMMQLFALENQLTPPQLSPVLPQPLQAMR
jgi:hypothetical protein